MPAFEVARRWKGRAVLDRTGGKLGSVFDVYYDAENDEPGWVLLGAAGADGGARLVPVAEAVEHGDELRVPYDRALVEGAPGMEPGGRLWPEEADLYAYYGLPYSGASLVDLDEEEEDVAAVRRLPG
jgi:hypothetical protein